MDRRERARRAYEAGRLKVAAVRAAPAVAFGVVAVVVAGAGLGSLVAAVLLGAAGAALVYLGGPAGRAVPEAWWVGWVPFALPLLVRGQVCPLGGACEAWCLAACATGGALAGGWLGWRSTQEDGGVRWLVSGLLLAGAAGALGCSCVGVPGLAGMALGAALTAPAMRRLALA